METQTLRTQCAHTPFSTKGVVDPNCPSELLDRMPPANLDAEASLLCCLLLDPKRMSNVIDFLQPDDLYDPFHRDLYRLLVDLWNANRRDFDAALVHAELMQALSLDRTLVASTLADIMNRQCSGVHAYEYAEQVVEMAQRRRWLSMAVTLLNRVWQEHKVANVASFVSEAVKDFHADNRLDRVTNKLITVPMVDVQSERLAWLWPGRIAMGKLTLIAGDPGLGKSFLSLDLAARTSRGDVWPDNPTHKAPVGDVLLLNAEDGLEDTVRPRLDAAGANVDRIVALTAVEQVEGGQRGFSLDRDLALLLKELERRPETKLIIIDPITAYLGRATGNNNTEVRSLLTPLAQLAQTHQVAVVVVTHLNKNSGGRALYRAMGSLAFVAAARSAWGVVRDPADAERRLFLPVKNNLSQEAKGLAYRLVEHPQLGTAHIGWFPEPVEQGIDELLQAPSNANNETSPQNTAVVQQWLKDFLANGPQPAEDIRHEAKQDGISPTQLRTAADKLQVRRRKTGFLDGWEWQLPKD